MDNGTCAGTRTDGKPCKARPGTSAYCMWHDPDRAMDRFLAAAKTRRTLAESVLAACRFAEAGADQLDADQRRQVKEMAAAAQDDLDELDHIFANFARDIIQG